MVQDRTRYEEAVELCRMLVESGSPTMFAGGCVRDRLLGLEPKDFDLATTMGPHDCMAFFKRAGYRVLPLGLEHGTIGVITAGQQVEITTLRSDTACDGRHAVVAFGTNFEGDAQRRDFTINALFEDADGQIHDFVGGVDDLRAKRLRFVGDPAARIREDYLRTLRFFRFLGRYGWAAEPDQAQAVADNAAGLTGLSAERVHAEMDQILGSANVAELLEIMNETGVLSTLFPWYQPQATNVTGRLLAQAGANDPAVNWFSLIFMGGARSLPKLKAELDRLRFKRSDRKWVLSLCGVFDALTTDRAAALAQLTALLEAQPQRAPALDDWLAAYALVIDIKPDLTLTTLVKGFLKRPPPLIPKQELQDLPARERGWAVGLVKIYWYLGLCRATSEIIEIMKKRNTFRLRLRNSDIELSLSPPE